MIFKIFSLFKGVSIPTSFILKNFFSILKFSLKAIGGENDDVKNFEKIYGDKRLQQQFSKLFHNSYNNSIEAARSRDAQIIIRNGRNLRADIMFYSLIVCFVFSSVLVVFFRNRLQSEYVAVFSALVGISGSCLHEIFGFEFGKNDFASKNIYVLDESDQPELFEKKYGK
ncbi:hypothetical protein [Alphaproteobacteria bacterium endosymbiont of Tiliacea citrago]|uniref:hypothetical protein n=1 Tax=Alphaproteobacteria bacterium endosymbiont of Tiliacea citrago TaxID=3077944 RepID=UPI00313E35ED